MNINRRLAPIAVSVFLLTILGPVFAQDAHDAEWQQLNDYFDGLTTLRADFEQTSFDEYGEVVDASSGTLAIQRPGLFRWEPSDDFNPLLVSDGRYFWQYNRDFDSVRVTLIDESFANTPVMLLSGDNELSQRFEISESGHRDGMDWITLKPRQAGTDFRLIVLSFDGGELAVMELADTLDQVSRVRFTNVVRNGEIPPGIFLFEPPEGVDIFGDTEGTP